ncbi:MAG: tyrosine-type recombinase/integrase [Acidobacteria bacterium]|nr:tyrosine-type recombinase/integrase [Acidobacteriota bacterium]
MDDRNVLGPWLRRFLLEHLVSERNLSLNTQRSYRDTLILLVTFLARTLRKTPERLTIMDLTEDQILVFLLYLENSRHCGVRTRNQRLSAIHALARFIGMRSPEHIVWSGQILAIPMKKAMRGLIPYLEKSEIDTLLESPDCKTSQGRRDRALLLFLYNSGARAGEAAQLTIADLDLARTPSNGQSSAKVIGKGRKLRRCPLWPRTAAELAFLVAGRSPSDQVFLNRRGQPLTRFGIHALVKRYARRASSKLPSLATKKVSPHTIRHTTATHLLRAGVDINTIRAWLGHVSIETTNVYAEVDLEMKAKALALCDIGAGKTSAPWSRNRSLLAFLRSL